MSSEPQQRSWLLPWKAQNQPTRLSVGTPLPTLVLDLVVAHHDLGVAWRGLVVARALPAVGVALLLRRRRGGGGAGAVALRCAVAHVALAGGLRLALALALRAGRPLLLLRPAAVLVLRDDDICHAAVLRVADALVVGVVGLRELGDDVPGVEEAREEAEDAEEDVDDRVGAADSTLDPDCR